MKKNMPSILSLFFVIIALFPYVSYGNHSLFETTRLKGTSGAGVASILLEEAAVLNPASLTFFNLSSIYMQQMHSEASFLDKNSSDKFSEENKTRGFIFADGKSSFKGSFSYLQKNKDHAKHDRYGFSTAYPIGKLSSLGILYNYNKIQRHTGKRTYSNFSVGTLHVINPSFSVGTVVIDPFRKQPDDLRVIIGAQYTMQNIFSLMADFGSDPTKNLSDKLFYKLALQLTFLNDIFLRIGTFRDREQESKGNSLGVAWVSPRLMFDFALKNTTFVNASKTQDSQKENTVKEKEKDMSLSLSFRF